MHKFQLKKTTLSIMAVLLNGNRCVSPVTSNRPNLLNIVDSKSVDLNSTSSPLAITGIDTTSKSNATSADDDKNLDTKPKSNATSADDDKNLDTKSKSNATSTDDDGEDDGYDSDRDLDGESIYSDIKDEDTLEDNHNDESEEVAHHYANSSLVNSLKENMSKLEKHPKDAQAPSIIKYLTQTIENLEGAISVNSKPNRFQRMWNKMKLKQKDKYLSLYYEKNKIDMYKTKQQLSEENKKQQEFLKEAILNKQEMTDKDRIKYLKNIFNDIYSINYDIKFFQKRIEEQEKLEKEKQLKNQLKNQNSVTSEWNATLAKKNKIEKKCEKKFQRQQKNNIKP